MSSSEQPEEDGFKPMTAEQAQKWRTNNRSLTVEGIVLLQLVVGAVFTLLVFLVAQNITLALSAAYGVLVVFIPAFIFSRALLRAKRSAGTNKNVMSAFALWELVKLMLSVLLMVAAPKLIENLNWFMMIAGMIVAMNGSWLALIKLPKKLYR